MVNTVEIIRINGVYYERIGKYVFETAQSCVLLWKYNTGGLDNRQHKL